MTDLDETSQAELAAWLDLIDDDGIVDLFAGPGGWDQALAELDPDAHDRTLGLEWDDDAVATRRAAGHRTAQADVAAFPLDDLIDRIVGIIGSPPCQAFSLAGRKSGRRATEELLAHVHACRDGWIDPPEALCAEDVRADLTLEPLRWALTLRPRWVVLEQVPPVLRLWEATAHVLEANGYDVWTGRLVAADYGVPQTRTRAILIARRDGLSAAPPEPTHYDPREGLPLFGDVRPWVTMAEALDLEDVPVTHLVGSMAAMTEDRTKPRPVDRPATTIAFGRSSMRWEAELVGDGSGDDPNRNGLWIFDRPATTLIGSGAVGRPGHRCMTEECCGTEGRDRHIDAGSWRLSVEAAAVLQGFPRDYPWQGAKGSRYRQVGNAVPPPMAAAILSTVIDTEESTDGP